MPRRYQSGRREPSYGPESHRKERGMEAERLDAYKTAPEAIKALRQVEAYIHGSGLDKRLIELVKMRASQLNGCAYCLDMHSKDLRRQGESEQRIYLLSAWHESPAYTPRERAALAWTDALTRVADTHAPDADWAEVRRHFDDKELVALTTLIGMINLWNRMAIGFRYLHPAG
jgi:AhpD family alkylhydroperoxidase